MHEQPRVRINYQGTRGWGIIHTSTSCEESRRSVGKRRGYGESTNLLVAKIQELLEFDATVRECTECPFFLQLGGEVGIGSVGHGWYVEW